MTAPHLMRLWVACRCGLGRVRLWAALCVVWALWGPWAPARAAEGVVVLDRAYAQLQLHKQAAPAPGEISLPLHWDVAYPRSGGLATLRLVFDLDPSARQAPHAVLIERLGNAYHIRLNGMVLASGGDMHTPDDGWASKRPLFLNVPPVLLRDHNELDIDLRADLGRRAGLSVVRVGPTATLTPHWRVEELLRVVLPQAAAVLSGLAAALCVLLWVQQRDSLYAFAALGEGAWGLRVMDIWWEASPFVWPVWALTILGLFIVWTFALYQMVLALWTQRPTWERRIAYGLMVLAPPMWIAGAVLGNTAWVIVWVAVSLTFWLVVSLALAWHVIRQPDLARGLLAGSMLASTGSIVRDALASRADPLMYADNGWGKFAAVCLALSVIAIVSTRFKRTKDDLMALQHSLEQRLQTRERELDAQNLVLRTLERKAAVAQERARILRDMHDGAGAHLITAMRQLEGGVASRQEVISTLRESLDQLRLSVDALALPPGDVNALLASLRFRLERRIQDAGLQLHWQVALLSPWAAATEEGMRHLQYILFEAISNVLQHAQATELTVSADMRPQGDREVIVLCVQDNGQGLPEQVNGNGMRTMRERAGLIGAALRFPAHPSGTVVQIEMVC